jgi:hypothetical protein
MTRPDQFKARISAILKRFTDPTNPDLLNFVSGVNDAGDVGAIDDGTYGDPLRDTRPDFVKRDEDGWEKI